jgi:pimeloyl-ACP methyl ester carboxylesterase
VSAVPRLLAFGYRLLPMASTAEELEAPVAEVDHPSSALPTLDPDLVPPLGAANAPGDLPWHRTRVQGRTATYAHVGADVAGDRLPTVLLHGWGLGHRAYREAIERLVGLGCEVWAPALPGFGRTSALPAGADLDGYADWVADFLQEVGVREPVLLVGHSFGGGVSIAAAHRHPGLVRAMVLVNSVGGATWREADDHGAELTLADRPWWDWGLHFPRDLLPWHQGRRVLPVVLREAVPNLLRNPVAMYRAGELARTADLTTELEELKRRRLPVVVVWGTRDGVIPRASFEALCRAVGAEGNVVDGTHSWLLADPVSFGEVITNAVEVARLSREAAGAPLEPPEGATRARRRDRIQAWWRRRRAKGPARRARRRLVG